MKSAPHKSTTLTLDLESSPVFLLAFFNKPKQKNGYKIDFATSTNCDEASLFFKNFCKNSTCYIARQKKNEKITNRAGASV